MTKNEIVIVYKTLFNRFPKVFKKKKKQEQIDYLKQLNDFYGRFDYKLVNEALNRIFAKGYPNPPSIAQLNLIVSRVLFERRSNVMCEMHRHGFYRKDLVGTKDEIDKLEYKIWDRISIEFLCDRISEKTKEEILNAVEEYEYLSKYKGLSLFDEFLPIPPGCDPNKDWNSTTPTPPIHSHNY